MSTWVLLYCLFFKVNGQSYIIPVLRSRGFWPASLAWSVGPRSHWETLPQKHQGRRLQKNDTRGCLWPPHTHAHTVTHLHIYGRIKEMWSRKYSPDLPVGALSVVLWAVFGVGQHCLIRYLQERKRNDGHIQQRLGHCLDKNHSSHRGTRSQRGWFGNEDQKGLSRQRWCMIILLADLHISALGAWLIQHHQLGDQIRSRVRRKE